MADIEIFGMEDVLRKLRKLPEQIQNNVVVGAVRAGTKPIINEAKRLVPIDTGDLEKSIGANRRKTDEKTVVMFTVSPRRGGKYDGFHGHLVEFGTKNMAAQPFMRPAYEKEGEKTIDATREYMAKRVEKEIEKL